MGLYRKRERERDEHVILFKFQTVDLLTAYLVANPLLEFGRIPAAAISYTVPQVFETRSCFSTLFFSVLFAHV